MERSLITVTVDAQTAFIPNEPFLFADSVVSYMDQDTQRRLSVAVGAFLLIVAVAVVAVARTDLLDSPLLAFQVGTLAAAGVLSVLAGFETRITERVAWYRLSGLGYVFLGLSLPFGSVGTTETLPVLLTVLGSLSIAGIGIDMLLFDGRHVYSKGLGETGA
jgi:hypothetical protein